MSTDADGLFRIDVSGGDVSSVIASASGYLPVRRSVRPTHQEIPLEFALEPGGVQLSGSVVDASGGVIVDAVVSAGRAGEPPVGLARTASTGRFVLTLPAGMLELSASADGYSTATRLVNAPHDGVELILTVASSVRGRVLVKGTGAPAADVEVTVLNADGLHVLPRSAITDPHGAFQVGQLPAGGYRVAAASRQWRSEERRLVLDMGAEEVIELFVARATTLTGSVRAGGEPCRGGVVSLDGPVPGFRAVDANGQVEFIGLEPGAYRAQVTCEPGMELTDQIEVGLAPVARVWELEKGSSLSGVVSSWGGEPLAGARVEIEPIGEPPLARGGCTSSDERGEFSCAGLEPGEYECLLRDDAVARSESVRVTIPAGGEPPSVSLRADPTASLSVRIQGGSSLQLDALAVVAQRTGAVAPLGRRKGSAPLVAQRTGEQFMLEQIPLGIYEVSTEPEIPGGRRTVQLVRAGATVELALSAPVSRTLLGRVVDEHGNGVPDVWVRVGGASLYGALYPAAPVMSDARGVFEVRGLLPGPYELSATSGRGGAQLDAVYNDGRPVSVPLLSYARAAGH